MEARKFAMIMALAVVLVLALGQVEAGKQPCTHIHAGNFNPMYRKGCGDCCGAHNYNKWINNRFTGCKCFKKNRV